MRLSTLLLSTLFGTSIAGPTNLGNGALNVREEVGSLDNLAIRAVDVLKRSDVSLAEQSDQQQEAVNAVQAILITSLVPYLYSGGSGILGNLVDALISLLKGIGLKKRHDTSKNPFSNTDASSGHTQKKRDQTVQLTQAEVAEVALETLETIKACHEAGASWHDALIKPFPNLGKDALKAGPAFDFSKLGFEAKGNLV